MNEENKEELKGDEINEGHCCGSACCGGEVNNDHCDCDCGDDCDCGKTL